MPGSGLTPDYAGGLRYAPVTTAGLVDRAALIVAPWLPVLATAWLFGVLYVSVQQLASLVLLRRVIRAADPIDGPMLETLSGMAANMHLARHVTFLETQRLLSPITVGVLRPLVLLPVSILSTFSAAEIEAIVAHELSHIRRFDFLVNNVQVFFETAFFYHPCVLWISRRLRRDRELCCDSDAGHYCQNFKLYAETLNRVAESFAAAPAHALAMTGGSLLERIVTLRQFQNARRVSSRALLVTFLACTGIAAAAGAAVVDRAWEVRERRALAALPSDQFFDLLFTPGSPCADFESAYVAALQSFSDADAEMAALQRLVDAANAGPDLNLVWRAYLPLITSNTYPTVSREYPTSWRYGEPAQHRRLITRLWRHALHEVQPQQRQRIVYAAIAIGCMRREENANTALRPVLTSRELASVSHFDDRTVRLLRQYWVDVNEQTGDAFVRAQELSRSPSKRNASQFAAIVKYGDQVPEAVFTATYTVTNGGAIELNLREEFRRNEVVRRATTPAAPEPKSPPVVVTKFNLQ